MATTGIKGLGCTLTYGTVDSGTYGSSVLYIQDIDGPSPAADDVDVTTNSSSGSTREFISGLIDSGELSCDVIHTISQTSTLFGLVGDAKDWKLTLPDNSYYTFTGYLKSVANSAPMGDAVKTPITLKVGGEITYDSGS